MSRVGIGKEAAWEKMRNRVMLFESEREDGDVNVSKLIQKTTFQCVLKMKKSCQVGKHKIK
jgi:hypothetical protein